VQLDVLTNGGQLNAAADLDRCGHGAPRGV
jgi:hypothetical protein